MNPDIFREFSIRGVASRDLPYDQVVVLGKSIGTYFRRRGLKTVVVGRDVRNSSFEINQALLNGLGQTGLQVIDIGQVPTPVLNFSVDLLKADGGVMITASHNPPEDNGFKIRAEHILHGKELQEIYSTAKAANFILVDLEGNVTEFNPLPAYVGRLKTVAHSPVSPLKIVVDGGNGTNGQVVGELLRDLGHDVVEIYCEPDGNFPNRSPDPTKPGAVDDLITSVRLEKADLGLAYDGDGDRLVVVDDKGRVILGDQIMMILARDLLRSRPAKVIYEILCTQALADDVVAHGGEPIMTPSGYAFVYKAMRETGGVLGGELSGHLFFKEPDFNYDDAILGTIKLLNAMTRLEGSLSTTVDKLPFYYSSPELRVPCRDDIKARVVEYVNDQFRGSHKVDTIDGARIHFADGWALVRQSNTQPVISMRFEARSAAQLQSIQTTVQSLVEDVIKQYHI